VIFPVFYAIFRVTLLELLAAYEAEGCRFESCWLYLLWLSTLLAFYLHHIFLHIFRM